MLWRALLLALLVAPACAPVGTPPLPASPPVTASPSPGQAVPASPLASPLATASPFPGREGPASPPISPPVTASPSPGQAGPASPGASPWAQYSPSTPGAGSASPRAYSHASDYSWVVGRLEKVELEGGFWQIVYQRGDQAPDAYGGKFVLVGPVPDSLRPGQMVLVRGRVAEEQMGISMAGPAYEVHSIVLYEPASPGP